MDYEIKRVGFDERGAVYEVKHGESVQVAFQTTAAGLARGGHNHKYEEEFFVVSGKVSFVSKDTSGKLNEPRYYVAGETIKTVPNEAHMMIAVEDTVLIAFTPKGEQYKADSDPQLREMVDTLWKSAKHWKSDEEQKRTSNA